MQSQSVVITRKIKLKDFDPGYCAGLEKEATKEQTKELVQRIADLQELLFANSKHSVLLLFQGLDASGKDGAIGSVLEQVNPVGVEVANFKVPSEEERAHDYLWRVHRAVPRYGNMGVFNRSHYEAVLAERVLGLVSPKTCLQRYEQIIAWERMLVENRVVILKFFLHLSRKEQAQRFRERLHDPRKKWKFSEADLVVRKKWKQYATAYEETLNATSHPLARWHVVPADRNWYRDFVIADHVSKAMEALNLKWPKPKSDLSKIRIK
ncbi:MAG TPA: PPK2 family polyphosphate kinase [Opitutus sp.]|nr:PPK2 family polyphosphate kinase [Opitutus sp.]